jgi:hypothetical protein
LTEQAVDGVVVDYWQSQDGILDRFSMLAEDVQLGTFNGAVKVYGTAYGVTDFTISGDLKATSCEWCVSHVGVTYHRGQFMPDLPRHPKCPHFYDITRVGEDPQVAQEKAFFEAMKSAINDWYQRALDFNAVGYMKNIVSTFTYEVQDIISSPSFWKLSLENQSKINALIVELTAQLEKVTGEKLSL